MGRREDREEILGGERLTRGRIIFREESLGRKRPGGKESGKEEVGMGKVARIEAGTKVRKGRGERLEGIRIGEEK